MAAGLVAPVGDEVKAGEVVKIDFGKLKEGVRVAAWRGRVCWDGCCCCIVSEWVKQKGL